MSNFGVMASRNVQFKLNSGKYNREAFMALFEKMKDPIYLKSKLHNEVKQAGRIDLDCFKQGNTSERIFYYTRDKTIFLGDIFMHDEYERFIANGRLLVSELEKERFTEL